MERRGFLGALATLLATPKLLVKKLTESPGSASPAVANVYADSLPGFVNTHSPTMVARFPSAGAVRLGQFTTVNKDGNIVAAAPGDQIVGVVIGKHDGIVDVMLQGTMQVRGG